MESIIYLPISIGEAIDKLTILDIKLDNIKDNRRLDIEKEYNLLHHKLSEFVDKYKELYNSMKKINKLIWDMMDKLRDEELCNDLYLTICKKCVEFNDIRFRIKNKINYLSKSVLKEQKSYKIKQLFIEMKENQDLTHFVIPIKYYSFFYDEINIIYDTINDSTLLRNYFYYDPTIKHYEYNTVENYNSYENNKKIIKFTTKIDNKNKIYEIFELNEDQINEIL